MIKKMKSCIYGVDVTKKITSVMVRDAIIRCLMMANKELFRVEKSLIDDVDDKKFQKNEYEDTKKRIFDLIKENGGDSKNPTKEDLVYVISKLRYFTIKFRDPSIVNKRAREIMGLIELIN